MFPRPAMRFAFAGLAFTLLLATACGDDDTPAATSTPPPTNTPEAAGTIEVTAVDYAFEGLPARVPAGTTFTLTNSSDTEVHEIVAIRIADGETRPILELLELSDEEIGNSVAEMPATVIVAMPGEEGTAVLGDGSISEAGRYAFLCFIPTGADPQAYQDAIDSQSDGPPEVDGGPPHAFQGMIAEVIVE